MNVKMCFLRTRHNITILDITLDNEPRHEKTGLRGFRPGPTQADLCSYRRKLQS